MLELTARAHLEELLRTGRILAIVEARAPGSGPIPVVLANRHYQADYATVRAVSFWCPWCARHHMVSAGPQPFDGNGYRPSACRERSAIDTGGYIIRERGLSDAEADMVVAQAEGPK